MKMNWIDIFGHFAYASLIAGQILITRKQAKGFILRIFGSLVWVLLGGFLGLSSVIVWSAVFAAVDIYGFWNWMKNRDIEYTKTMIIEPTVKI